MAQRRMEQCIVTKYRFTPEQLRHLREKQAVINHFEQSLNQLREDFVRDVATISGVGVQALQSRPFELDIEQGVLREHRPPKTRIQQ